MHSRRSACAGDLPYEPAAAPLSEEGSSGESAAPTCTANLHYPHRSSHVPGQVNSGVTLSCNQTAWYMASAIRLYEWNGSRWVHEGGDGLGHTYNRRSLTTTNSQPCRQGGRWYAASSAHLVMNGKTVLGGVIGHTKAHWVRC